MFFNWACVPSSNCVGAECFKDTCSKDAVFPLAHVDLWKLFSPILALSDLLPYGSRIAKQCEAAFHDVLRRASST